MWVNGELRTSQEETLLRPPARTLLRYWETLRAGRPAPERRDLDLKHLRHLVPFLFIAEQAGTPANYIWRLAGTAVCGLHRRELTGTDLLSGWEDFEQGMFWRFLSGVTAAHKQAVLRLAFLTDRSQQINAEMLALPLIASDGVNTHILGGLFPAPQQDIRHYDTLSPLEVSFARFLDHDSAKISSLEEPSQARRKFRVISGGLDHS